MGLNIITDNGERLSTSELQKQLDLFGSQLPQRSLLFMLCSNTIGSLVGYLGSIENKIIPIMLDSTKSTETLQSLLDIYRPNYIWSPVEAKLVDSKVAVYEVYGYGLYKYSDENAHLHESLALLLTTSGSTGSPKLVRLSYNNIWSNADSIVKYLKIDENEKPVTSLPMYYSFGLSVINSHYRKNATLLLTDKAVIQKEFWNFVKEQEATSISGVPYTYEMLKRLRIFRMDLPKLKTMTQAGGKLNAKLAQEYIENAKAAGKRFIVMYGQTEATARMSYLPEDKAIEKYSSIGVAIPGGKFSLIDTDGNEITTPDVDGELVYEGANVSMGYAECIADLAKGDENNGVLHTGDVARRDADGFYYITGRLKRFVKVWGNRCNLDAIEQIVKTEVTTNCACSGVDDMIVVFVTEGGYEERIKALLCDTTGLNARAFTVKQIDSIPKTASGKIQYAELLKQIEE